MLAYSKKISLSVIILCISALFLTACDSEEQKKQNAEWEAQAAENAKAYISQKYGFSAETINAEVDRQVSLFGSHPLSDVIVQMQYENRDFTVFITGEKESTDGCDTYQASEIQQALFDIVNSEIDGLQVLDIYPKYKSEREIEEPLYAAYFDGSNLAEMLEDGVRLFEAFYVQKDFSDEKDFSWLNDYGTAANFVSCREDTILNAGKAARNYAAPHGIYCDNSRTFSFPPNKPMQTAYQTYELYQYDDFYYCVERNPKQADCASCENMLHFSEVEPPDPSVFNGWGAMNATIISKAYSVSVDSPVHIDVYFPLSTFDSDLKPKIKGNHIDCGRITTDEEGTVKYFSYPIKLVADYAYMYFDVQENNSITFALLYDP